MSETKFTPGPWEYKRYEKGLYGVGITETDDQVAKVEWHPEHDNEAESNARLISAAPDLYEALNELAQQAAWVLLPAVRERQRPSDAALADIDSTLRKTHAAIAKARG